MFFNKTLWVFVFCIFLQTATSAMKYSAQKDLYDGPDPNKSDRISKPKYDKLLSNLHNLLREQRDTESSKSVDYNDFNYNSKEHNKKDLDVILSEVTSTLDKIKEELIKFKNDGILEVETPSFRKSIRYKRDITNSTKINATLTENEKVVFKKNNETTTVNVAVVTEKPVILRSNNESAVVKKEIVTDKNITEPGSGRRMIPEYVATNSRVKDKLLSYLEDTFNEVERKIKPLTNIKIALSNDDHYRIGYIIATIDTLEVNLKKLKKDMNLHQSFWDDEKILDLFDRIKATNTVTTSLIESLKNYLPRN